MLSKVDVYFLLSLREVFFAPVCLALGGMCVFISCCAVLSPRWQSPYAPLWVVFDFATCGETFHLLIFPGVQGHGRLCKHTVIRHQPHNRLQSFLIPHISLRTTINMISPPLLRLDRAPGKDLNQT